MAVVALGRIGSAVIAPSESLDLHVFIDAGGRADSTRVWGGLACVGGELSWIDNELSRLKALLPHAIDKDGELKGKCVPIEYAKESGRKFRQEDRRILFWANQYVGFDEPEVIKMCAAVSEFLADLHPDSDHPERQEIEEWNRERLEYFGGLAKPVNRHKLISMVAHMNWLYDEIRRVNLGPQLRSAHIVVDEENLPCPRPTNRFLTAFFSAGFQSAGMSSRRTGGCFRRVDTGGSHVTVNASAKSHEHAALQYVDIHIQVVQRQLPGFAATSGPVGQ
jgi:hypothetical protein